MVRTGMIMFSLCLCGVSTAKNGRLAHQFYFSSSKVPVGVNVSLVTWTDELDKATQRNRTGLDSTLETNSFNRRKRPQKCFIECLETWSRLTYGCVLNSITANILFETYQRCINRLARN